MDMYIEQWYHNILSFSSDSIYLSICCYAYTYTYIYIIILNIIVVTWIMICICMINTDVLYHIMLVYGYVDCMIEILCYNVIDYENNEVSWNYSVVDLNESLIRIEYYCYEI